MLDARSLYFPNKNVLAMRLQIVTLPHTARRAVLVRRFQLSRRRECEPDATTSKQWSPYWVNGWIGNSGVRFREQFSSQLLLSLAAKHLEGVAVRQGMRNASQPKCWLCLCLGILDRGGG